MPKTREKFVINDKGKRVSVILNIEDYQQMLRDLEELESVRAYDAAKASGDEAVPFGQATEEIEKNRP